MMFKSIRSRLALSFAGIALVAALVLGAVLLTILRDYYSNQELNYLRINSQICQHSRCSDDVCPCLAR